MKKLLALLMMLTMAFTLCACTFLQACSVCKGEKNTNCLSCYGTGKIHFKYCKVCGGNGTIVRKCSRCQPDNISSQCSVCDGKFIIEEVCKFSDNERCSKCDGTGLKPCNKCNK